MYEIFSNVKKPGKKKINFHLILIAAPAMFFGSFLGVNFNKIAPDVIVLIGVTGVLVFCVIMSGKKYKKKRKLELERKEEAQESFDGDYNSLKSGENSIISKKSSSKKST